MPTPAAAAIRVSVPATSANLGPGFDCLGAALDLRNHFLVALAGASDNVGGEATGPEAAGLSFADPANLVSRSFRAGWSLATGLPAERAPGHTIQAEVNIPQARGLGSSSTAIVAGAVAGYRLGGGGAIPDDRFLDLLAELEGHPDNVLPAALGGLVCGAWDAGAKRLAGWQRWSVSSGVCAALLIPAKKLATAQARAALPAAVSMADAIHNAARTPLVVEALRRGDVRLLAAVCGDKLHEPYRRALFPFYDEAKAMAAERGLPCMVSGAGTTMIAWGLADEAEDLAAAFEQFARERGGSMEARALLLRPSPSGWLERFEGAA